MGVYGADFSNTLPTNLRKLEIVQCHGFKFSTFFGTDKKFPHLDKFIFESEDELMEHPASLARMHTTFPRLMQLTLKNLRASHYVTVLANMMRKSYTDMAPKMLKFDAFLHCLLELNDAPDHSDYNIELGTVRITDDVVHNLAVIGEHCIFPADSVITRGCSTRVTLLTEHVTAQFRVGTWKIM